MEMMNSTVVSGGGSGSWIDANAYQIFTACMWASIVSGAIYTASWAKKRFTQLYRDIGNQQEEIMAYTSVKIDNFMDKYNDVLNKVEDECLELRGHVVELEKRVAYLQAIVPTEITMKRIRDDANANYANLGQRISSLQSQHIRDIHELNDIHHTKRDELAVTLSTLTTQLDSLKEGRELNNTKLTARLDDLNRDYVYFIQCVKQDYARESRCDELSATISNLTARFDSHLEKYLLTARYVQEDDEYKQVLIGYRRSSDGHYEDPIFCPRYTTDFDKYLGKCAILLLDGLAQLPLHKPFIFADYYLHCGALGSNVVSAFVDRHWNVISLAGYNPGNITTDHAINEMCNNDFKRVQEYCEKIGVKCLTK
jgi:polyhydroxyalkanoate synthesis regulator phasin